MALQSKMTVYAAIGGVLALMGGIVYYASLDNVQLEQAAVSLAAVELRSTDAQAGQAKLDVTFLVSNPSDKTFTVSLIAYDLYADGRLLGGGQYSAVDIALPGRPVIYPGAEVPLKSTFVLGMTGENAEAYGDVAGSAEAAYAAEGVITTETAWSLVEKEFRSELG